MLRTLLPVVLLAFSGAGCDQRANVQCEQNSNCDLSSGGVCAAAVTGNRWCTYPDSFCPGGYRYSSQAVGDELSGSCVPVMIGVDAGTDVGTDVGTEVIPDWIVRYGSSVADDGVGIAVAPNGDLVTSGNFGGTLTLGGGALLPVGREAGWVARYKPDGIHVWSVRVSNGTKVFISTALAVDAQGDVYVHGGFNGTANFGGGIRTATTADSVDFIVKLSGADGSYIWDHVFLDNSIRIQHIISTGPNVAACGSFTGSADFGAGPATAAGGLDSFIAVYSGTSGTHVWSKPLVTSGEDVGFCNVVGVNDDLLVSADFSGTAMLGGPELTAIGDYDMMMVRYRGTDGAHVWSTRHGAAGSSIFPKTMISDGASVYVGGGFSNTTNLGGPNLTATIGTNPPTGGFVASYETTGGSHIWSQQYGGDIFSIAASATKLVVGITFSGTITLGSSSFTSTGPYDILLAGLSSSAGTPGTAFSQFASTERHLLQFAYDHDRLAGVGTFSGSVNLFGTTLLSAGSSDIAVFRVEF